MATRQPSVQDQLRAIKDLDLGSTTPALFLASGGRNDAVPTYQQVQVTDAVAAEFIEVFRGVREGINEDTELRAYDPGGKPDAHEIEYVRLEDLPEIANQVQPLYRPARAALFEGDEPFVAGLRFYSLALQSPRRQSVLAFRAYGRQKELGRSRSLGFLFRAGQFTEVRQPLFLFDQYLDCVISDGTIFVFRQHDFQKLFRYYELVEAAAEESLARIQAAIPLANFPAFADSCRGHLQKMAKLKNIAQKPYLGRVTIDDLRRVIEKFHLEVAIENVNGTDLLVFDESDRWAILRLLDDDYLESLMTEQLYEVTGKRVHDQRVLQAGG